MTQQPERQLLLAAARVHPEARARERLSQLLATELDWASIARSAQQHGVAPLVFHTLTETAGIAGSDPRLSSLRGDFLANAANSLVLSQALVDVLGAFARAGIATIPYKGPALAALLYGHVSLREFTDLDVIVKPAQVAEARRILVACGYEPQVAFTAAQERSLVASRAGYFLRFDRPQRAGRVALELHWRIPATFALDDGFWDRTRTVRLLERDAQHVAPEDLLLILCAHGFKHGWSQLKWLCDVRELLCQRPALNQDLAIERARQAGGLRILLVGCALARMALDATLSSRMSACIEADAQAVPLAEQFARFDRANRPVGVRNNLRIRDRRLDQVRYLTALAARFTVPTAADRVARPDAGLLAHVSQPLRVFTRIVRKYRG